MKRLLCFVLLLALIGGLLAGCAGGGTTTTTGTTAGTTKGDGTTAPGETGDLDPVTLTWISTPDDDPNTANVMAKINEILGEKINATLDLMRILPAEYSQQLSIYLTSGQDLDLCRVTQGYGYNSYVAQGAFTPLNDLIDQYAPALWDIVPEGSWGAATYNDNIYAVVPYKDLAANWGLLYNGDMVDETGVEVPDWVTLFDLIPFFEEIKAARDNLHPEWADLPIISGLAGTYIELYYPNEMIANVAAVQVSGYEFFKGQGDGETVFNIYATDEYRNVAKLAKKYVDEGLAPYGKFDEDQTIFNSGALIGVLPQGYIEIREDMYPFTTRLKPANLSIMSTAYVQACMNAIPVQSKNPERTMMLLNLLNTDKELGTLIRFGIEGEDYALEENGHLDPYKGSNNAGVTSMNDLSYYIWYGHHFGNIVNTVLPNQVTPEFPTKLAALNDNSHQDGNIGFIMDPEPITNEIAACANIISEYHNTTYLMGGMVEDVDAAVDEFVAKLEANGSQKIVDEIQKQLTEWRKSVGKPTK